MPDETMQPAQKTRSQQEFVNAPEHLQQILRAVLREEREVMHLRRRPEIHQKIFDHVRRIVP